MQKSLPPLTWFRAFDAAARPLSFTQAANELGLTQSAISQHVRSLEDHLATPLFIRSHRSLQLTDAARLLVPDVAASLARLAQATERFVPQTDRPRLTLATSVSVAQHLIAPHLSTFQNQHPDVAIQIVTAIWPDDFASTNADIEIRFGTADVVGQGAELLHPSMLHAVATPEICASSAQTLQDQTLIQPLGLSTSWSAFANLPDREADIFVDTHGLAVDLALGGAGIALTHSLITGPALKAGHLATLPLPAVPAEEGYYLHQKTATHQSLQTAFIDWLDAQIAQHQP
jgi:LysR family glycine cleavage system transcriptional activator